MSIIRWLYGHTLTDKIKNKMICSKVGVTPLEDKIQETRFRWFEYVRRRDTNAPIRGCEKISALDGTEEAHTD